MKTWRMVEDVGGLATALVVHHGDHPGTTGRHFAEAAQRAGGRACPLPRGRHLTLDEVADDEHLVWVESGAASYPLDTWELEQPSVGYLIDVHQHLSMTLLQAHLFDVVFVAQKKYLRAVRAVHPGAEWLPLGAPRSFVDLDREPVFQVGFVGAIQGRPERERLMAYLNERFAMNDWRRPHSVAEMAQVYRRSRFVINPPIRHDLNMRAFEAMAAGAVLVTPHVLGLDAVGRNGAHFVIADFTSPEGPTEAISRVIDTDAEARIASAGRAEVAAGHTYDHRLAAIADVAAATPRRAPVRSMSSGERAELYMRLAVANHDGALARYAAHLSPRPRVFSPVARALTLAAGRRTRRYLFGPGE